MTVTNLSIGVLGNVYIKNGGKLTVTNLRLANFGKIYVEAGGELVVDGDITMNTSSNVLENAGTFTMNNGGTWSIGSASTVDLSGTSDITATIGMTGAGSNFDMTGGTTDITGNVTLNGDASNSFDGVVTITGNLTVEGSATGSVGGDLTVTGVLKIWNDANIGGTGTIGWGTSNINPDNSPAFLGCNGSATKYDDNAATLTQLVPPYNPLNLTTCGPKCAVIVPGTITANQTICSGEDIAAFASTLAASGGFGGVIDYQWQSSTTSAVAGFSNLGGASTSETYNHGALAVTTWFRRAITSGTCGTAYTAAVEITVDPTTDAGTVTTSAAVCTGINGATLTLAGHNGTIVRWESSIDNFVTPVVIAHVTTTHMYSNLGTATKFRAVVKSGSCVSANSAEASITLVPTSVGGTITTNAT